MTPESVIAKEQKGWKGEMVYLSQARFAQAYALAISSSCLRLLHLLRDCANKELASSINSGGREPEWRGMRLLRA